LYFFEYCWPVNVLGWTYLAFEAAAVFSSFDMGAHLSGESRIQISRAFFAIANGSLTSGLYMNGDCLIFHDVMRASSTFIHLHPALVSYTMRWLLPNSLGLFNLQDESNFLDVKLTEHLLINPTKIYFCWWVLYGIWLFAYGCTLPDKTGGRSSF